MTQRPPLCLLLATANPHKLEELRAVFAPAGIETISLADIPNGASIPEPEETGDTFEANARMKAIAYAAATGHLCLADDSGLEVDALAGAPGVHSAYYAGHHASRAERDARNNAKLLRELADVPPHRRTARFICCMCIADPSGRIIATSRGTYEGVIGSEPRGENGFGYDPLLNLPDGRSSAELSSVEKNRRSHRGAAARDIADRAREAPGSRNGA